MPTSPGRRRPLVLRAHRLVAGLVLLLGMLGAKALGDSLVASERERQAAEFDQIATRAAADLEREVGEILVAVGGVGDLVAVRGADDVDAIRAGSLAAMERVPRLVAIGWARAVEDVAAHEATRTDGLEVRPTREGPAVFLDVITPTLGNESALGMDLLAERHRSQAVTTARDEGTPVASAPVQKVPIVIGEGLTTVLAVPVYAGGRPPITLEGRRANFLGVVSSVISPTEIFPAAATDQTRLEVWDVGAVGGDAGLPVHMASSDGRVVAGQDVGGPRQIVELPVAGRRWEVVVDGVGLDFAISPWMTTGVPVGGSVIALLLASLVLLGGASLERAHRHQELLWLREREREAAVEAFGDGYLRLSPDLVVQHASGNVAEHLGRPLSEVLGGSASQELLELARAALASDAPVAGDVHVGAPGEDTVLEVRASSVGEGVAVSLRDVSARAAMERDLRAAHASITQLATALEQRVADRTKDLEALTEDLERANGELEKFVYLAAHELRTPLTMIVGSLAWISEYLELDELETDLVARSQAAAGRMRDRITTLVDEAHGIATTLPVHAPAGGTDRADVAMGGPAAADGEPPMPTIRGLAPGVRDRP